MSKSLNLEKNNFLSDLTNGNYLALTDWIVRSFVIVIKFILVSSHSRSVFKAPFRLNVSSNSVPSMATFLFYYMSVIKPGRTNIRLKDVILIIWPDG